MRFIGPKHLQKGDVVGIFAPSDWFSRKRFDEGIKILKSWGLRVKIGEHVFDRVDDFMAGTTEARVSDFRKLIFDDEVKVMWAAEGGYAAVDIRYCLGAKELEQLRRKPKWFIGYSDVTVLTNALFSLGISSVMGPNIWGLSYWDKQSLEWIRKLIFGEILEFPRSGDVLVEGEAKGRLLASNLESLSVSLGTKYDPILHGDEDLILLVEEWKQDQSTLIRQIESVFDHERFDRIKGVILGRFALMMNTSYLGWAKNHDLGGLIKEKLLERGKLPMVRVDYVGHPSYSTYAKGVGRDTSLAMPNGALVRLLASKKVEISCLESITT